MADTTSKCACDARTAEEALARTLRFLGVAARGAEQDGASAVLYNLREHGWTLTRDAR